MACGSNRILGLLQYIEICNVTTVLPSISKENKVFQSVPDKTSQHFSWIQRILVQRLEKETKFIIFAVF